MNFKFIIPVSFPSSSLAPGSSCLGLLFSSSPFASITNFCKAPEKKTNFETEIVSGLSLSLYSGIPSMTSYISTSFLRITYNKTYNKTYILRLEFIVIKQSQEMFVSVRERGGGRLRNTWKRRM